MMEWWRKFRDFWFSPIPLAYCGIPPIMVAIDTRTTDPLVVLAVAHEIEPLASLGELRFEVLGLSDWEVR